MLGRATALAHRLAPGARGRVRRALNTAKARRSVRVACDLPDDAPLIAYAGRVTDDRAAGTAVEALALLPTHHLAIVAPPDTAGVRKLCERAAELGVAARLHVVARRVADPAFLSTADIGLAGFERRPDDPAFRPPVVDAYLAAGLPIAAAESRAMKELFAERRVGTTFAAGNPASFAKAVERLSKVVHSAPAEVTTEPEPVPATPWRPLGATRIRLGLGTANFAGQLTTFATALSRANPDLSAEVVMTVHPGQFRYPADVYLEARSERALEVQAAQVRRVLGGYTHLIVDAYRPVLGRLNGDDVSADLPALRRAGIKVALLAHGSEVRDPEAHLSRHAESGFLDAPADLVDRLIEVTAHNRRTAQEAGLPLFVTTGDLLDDLPGATWAPLVVDVDAWACDRTIMQRSRPVVVHAPSSRWTKGTDRLLPVLAELEAKQAIELRLIEGVPWSEMQALVQDADIVIDELVMGGYCALSCEAMAAGKAVIAYVGDTARKAAGGDVPIVNATPSTVADAITSLLDDRDRAVEIGRRAVQYARDNHDGRRTAAVFADFLR